MLLCIFLKQFFVPTVVNTSTPLYNTGSAPARCFLLEFGGEKREAAHCLDGRSLSGLWSYICRCYRVKNRMWRQFLVLIGTREHECEVATPAAVWTLEGGDVNWPLKSPCYPRQRENMYCVFPCIVLCIHHEHPVFYEFSSTLAPGVVHRIQAVISCCKEIGSKFCGTSNGASNAQ